MSLLTNGARAPHAPHTLLHPRISLLVNHSDITVSFSIVVCMSLLTNARARLTRFHISLSGNHCDYTVRFYIAICTCHSQTARARLTRFHISLSGNHCDTTVSLSNVICVCHCSQTARVRLTCFQGWSSHSSRPGHLGRVRFGY